MLIEMEPTFLKLSYQETYIDAVSSCLKQCYKYSVKQSGQIDLLSMENKIKTAENQT